MKKSWIRFTAMLLVFALALSLAGAAMAKVLKYGDVNTDVKELQRLLKNRGYYSGSLDGRYGLQTQMAVSAFQGDNGLKVDGKAGPSTLAALKKVLKYNTETLELGSTGPEVTKVQKALKSKGYYSGSCDGVFGASTKTAVIEFQKAEGISADGKAGPATRNKLYVGITQTGSEAEAIKKLQTELKNKGFYSGEIDGYYGKSTSKAVAAFQATVGLQADGKAGTKTLNALYGKTATVEYGLSDEAVVKLQTELKARGFYYGLIDGKFGPDTKAAVIAYQKSVGITADGKPGEETLNKLYNTGDTTFKTLRRGSTGNAVRKLQNALKKKHFYKGLIDGIYGDSTEKAVIAYQKSIGITADGKAGWKTQNALYNGTTAINKTEKADLNAQSEFEVKDQHALYYGCTGSRVKTLQRALKAAGYYKGSIDGVYGDLTRSAVIKYQTAKGLSKDGIAGKATITSLNKNTKYTISSSFILSVGSRGNEVYSLTKYLTDGGYLPGAVNKFDAGVAAAVRNWQADKGKSVTGTISEAQYNRIILGYE